MRLLHRIFAAFMRSLEERMISRLIRQRDRARATIDTYRRAMRMRIGEFLPEDDEDDEACPARDEPNN